MKPEEEIHARHILVPTEDEAKKVEERLKKGEDFATVAKENVQRYRAPKAAISVSLAAARC